MYIDRGLNDRWVRPQRIRRVGRNRYAVTLTESLGKAWKNEIVSYPFPQGKGMTIAVSNAGRSVPCQQSGERLSLLVESLAPGERKEFSIVFSDEDRELTTTAGIQIAGTPQQVVMSNGTLAIRMPASGDELPSGEPVPGPLLGVRFGNSPYLGKGCLESPLAVRSIENRIMEFGALWTTLEVVYTFEGGAVYRVRFTMRPNMPYCEVEEESTLRVRLWPAPRPYREIGSLGASFWNQAREDIAKPCLRPCPSSNVIFDLRAGFSPDRLITHSTACWEIMDLALGSPALKTYTAMRPALPFIDGGWLGVYDSGRDEILGVVSLDIAHWGIPDDVIHPKHRTVGANTEVILVDSAEAGSYLRFPIENLRRRWLLTVASRREGLGETEPIGHHEPICRQANSQFPLWELRTRLADLPLNKVKDWVTGWPDTGDDHPRVLCGKADFPAIREKVRAVPELCACYERTGATHCADQYLMEGSVPGLAAIEKATHAKALVESILQQGYVSPTYCIALARPLRRYAIACDIQWDSFTPAEKREARRVCALAAYILSDGDWWQYVFRPGETTYLPNFNTDVFTCFGIIGFFLSDHPCSALWIRSLITRMNLELKTHLRPDGGGEENVGGYLVSTWQQLYMPALWALRRNGVKDYSADPNILGGARFLLEVLGPPDVRDGALRQMPPIGHHPYARKCPPLFAWLAAFVKEADPALAANLMWAWRSVGSPVYQNGDHSGPLANPFSRHYVFHDPTIPEQPPALESHNLPHVGAVLRSHGTSELGSYLFLKAGRVHSHHDDDEGSFHYFARGMPLALDGLPVQNGATAQQHNAVTFTQPGQPSGMIEKFTTTPEADYIRARIAPRAFACNAMFTDGTHRSGFTREIVFVKSPLPGGVEYLVVKDTSTGPDPCQWNLDVLSRQPAQVAAGQVRFPGHAQAGFGMGLDIFFLEPVIPEITFEAGVVNPKSGRTVTEHWLLHAAGGPGTTFLTVLFPRRDSELMPQVEYCMREETVRIIHGESRDLIFLRPNPAVGADLEGVRFAGRAGLARRRNGDRHLINLDAGLIVEQAVTPAPLRFL
ncbi:MAG: hypothetical protein L6437_02990 [Kiritimatiellae bacterium]|nr:hypothetical protein [Kiritimatiellia bacterium]